LFTQLKYIILLILNIQYYIYILILNENIFIDSYFACFFILVLIRGVNYKIYHNLYHYSENQKIHADVRKFLSCVRANEDLKDCISLVRELKGKERQ